MAKPAVEQALETAAVDEIVADAPTIVKEIVDGVEKLVEKAWDLGEQEIDNYRRAHAGTPYVQPEHQPAVDADDETEAK